MGEDFAHGFIEIFVANVFGGDIAEARFNAWTALAKALGESLPLNHWQLAAIEHRLTPQEKEVEGENGEETTVITELVVIAEATFKFNSEKGDGGQFPVELLPSEPSPDSLAEPKEPVTTKKA